VEPSAVSRDGEASQRSGGNQADLRLYLLLRPQHVLLQRNLHDAERFKAWDRGPALEVWGQ
jgi:hypothetical protein